MAEGHGNASIAKTLVVVTERAVSKRIGGGSLGVPDFAPFDGIFVSATYSHVP